MIGYLKGEVIDIDVNKLVLLTDGGVGYELGITDLVFGELSVGMEAELFVYHHITENNQSLFGFLAKQDKQVFEELLKISGVGGKVALQILSLGVTRLSSAVLNEDKATIESIKGIGKKMAEKIILELKDKDFIKNNVGTSVSKKLSTPKLEQDTYSKVKTTLSTMGYNPKAIDEVLSRIPEDAKELGEVISFAVREL